MPDDSLLGRIADLEEEAEGEHAAAAAAAAAARPAEDDEDEIYVLLDFNGAEMPPGTKITGEMKVEVCRRHTTRARPAHPPQLTLAAHDVRRQGLDTDAPIIHLGDHIMRGKFEELSLIHI